MAQEHALYTWDPVTQAWVHERGPEIPPPPAPPDIHALQSYFFDEDSKQWIRTVLAPMGRELAAKWQGAHKIPDDAIARKAAATAKAPQSAKKKSSPVGIILVAVVLLVALGGVGVVASQNGILAQVTAQDTPKPSGSALASVAASAAPSATAEQSPSPSPSAAAGGGGGGGGGPARTPVPQGAVVTQPPNSSQLRLPDGTTFYYYGPTLVIRNTQLAVAIVAANPQGRALSGVVTVLLGNTNQAQGILDSTGHLVVNVLASNPSGQYPLNVLYNGQLGQVALITVR